MKEYPTPIFDDAHDQRQAEEQAKQARAALIRQRVRERFPTVTEFADEMRAKFPGTRLIWALENDNRVGNVPADILQEHEAKHGPTKDITKE